VQRILIADDDADLRATFVELLMNDGVAVHEACDGEAALAAALLLVPDLLLLDLNMPRMDGPQVLRRVREIHPPTRVRVIVISGQLEEYLPRLEGRHYHAALAKPCSMEDLLQTVRRVLQ
jgi:CheY-like chemotaxis protein